MVTANSVPHKDPRGPSLVFDVKAENVGGMKLSLTSRQRYGKQDARTGVVFSIMSHVLLCPKLDVTNGQTLLNIMCTLNAWMCSGWATMYLNKDLISCACLCTDRRTSCCIYSYYITSWDLHDGVHEALGVLSLC